MSAIPAFEIGVWNAWIFMPYLFLIMLAVGKLKKGEAPKNELDNLGKTEKRIFIFFKAGFFLCRDILYFFAFGIGDDMVLRRSSHYPNRIGYIYYSYGEFCHYPI